MQLSCHRAEARPRTLVIHGGAGGRIREFSSLERQEFEYGLRRAHEAGQAVLDRDGSALDAVCIAVQELEENPLFNAGRGAALTADGHAELDASVMDGKSGLAGAVAASRYARSPVFAARAVMEQTEHVLITNPPASLIQTWGLETVEPDWFITEARRSQLERVLQRREAASRHGTVGAVARDHAGHLAAATSTGGITAQSFGRIGDSPVIGAGTYARDGLLAISCTGEGEAFLRAVLAHDVAARMRYGGRDLENAALDAIEEGLTERGASGGIIAVNAEGEATLAFNSAMMFAAYTGADGLVLFT